MSADLNNIYEALFSMKLTKARIRILGVGLMTFIMLVAVILHLLGMLD